MHLFIKNLFSASLALFVFLAVGDWLSGGYLKRAVPLGAFGIVVLILGLLNAVWPQNSTATASHPRRVFLTAVFIIGSMIIVWLALKGVPRFRTEGTLFAGALAAVFFTLVFRNQSTSKS